MITQDATDPTGVAADENGSKEVVRARDRKANAAIQLRISGADWEDIAVALGFPDGRAVQVATERALEKELRAESRDALRQMAGKRLERLLRATWPKAIDAANPEQLAAVGKAREVIADYRKLFGLDAPTEITVHSPSEAEIEAWVSGIKQQIAPALEEGDIFDGEVVSDETEMVDA